MRKNEFTAEDRLKKHETNVKSAISGYCLAGILGLVYIIRFIITKNLDFYFSLTFTRLMLVFGIEGKISTVVSLVLSAGFILAYFLVAVLAVKDAKSLWLCLGVYVLDCLCFVPLAFALSGITPDFFIDVIVHVFVIVFLAAGIASSRKINPVK